MPELKPSLSERITQYLCVGGLLNPESMEHDKVRDLLIDCRTELDTTAEQLAVAVESLKNAPCSCDYVWGGHASYCAKACAKDALAKINAMKGEKK